MLCDREMRQLSWVGYLSSSQHKKDGYRQLNVRQLGSLRPWDYRGKCHTVGKRI